MNSALLRHTRFVCDSHDITDGFDEIFAAVALVVQYGKVLKSPSVVDLVGHSVKIILDIEDTGVLGRHAVVSEESLSYDVLISAFVPAEYDDPRFYGWIDPRQVQEAETVTPGRYVVPLRYWNPLPKKFDFTDPCAHEEKYGAIWDYAAGAWECCGCGRYRLDRSSAETIRAEDLRLLRRFSPPVVEEEPDHSLRFRS